MFALGLQDDCTEPFIYYGPFDSAQSAREWLEKHHSDTYEIRGDYCVIKLRSPEESRAQEAKAYG